MKMFRNFRKILVQIDRKLSTKVQNATEITETLPKDDIETKLLKVAVIGVPNSGKSTFINHLMDRKVRVLYFLSILLYFI